MVVCELSPEEIRVHLCRSVVQIAFRARDAPEASSREPVSTKNAQPRINAGSHGFSFDHYLAAFVEIAGESRNSAIAQLRIQSPSGSSAIGLRAYGPKVRAHLSSTMTTCCTTRSVRNSPRV